jgi:hypothetical protein
MTEHAIIGLVERVTILGRDKKEDHFARIDTGATKSSMDIALAEKLGLGPITGSRFVKNAHGETLRPIVRAELILHEKQVKASFTLVDRTHMKYRILIGRNVLKHGFLIDPNKTHESSHN